MSSSSIGNPISVSSCMYSTVWPQKSPWIVRDDFYADQAQITAPTEDDDTKEDETSTKPLREKNRKARGYKHVPHRDKPAQVVAKRNARERRRVQAVNTAFARLRKAVPVENTRGKRISKVKTLQNAIDYIYNLQKLLEQDRTYQPLQVISHYYSNRMNEDFFDNFNFQDEL